MPSTSKTGRVCPKCYLGTSLLIHTCGTESVVVYFGTQITVPKAGNKRAWKRVLNGEKRWNRRKRRRHGWYHDDPIWYERPKKGQRKRFSPSWTKTKDGPDVDLGG